MKITIENTTKIVTVNGVAARIWEGTTESGIPIHCYVTRIAVPTNQDYDHSQFERELQECRAPSADVAALPPGVVL